MVLEVKNPPANAGSVRDLGLIPGWGRFPGGGHGNPLQYSCLEIPHGQRSLVTKSWAPLKRLATYAVRMERSPLRTRFHPVTSMGVMWLLRGRTVDSHPGRVSSPKLTDGDLGAWE